MEPTRDTKATLVDLLDRLLDKGLILNADLIIHIAGIPLIGINLKACLAGIDTMLLYGIWSDWEEAQRIIALEERRKKKSVPLDKGEEVYFKVFASHWYSEGIYQSWRLGSLYLTNKRVFLYRSEPAEILFSVSYEDIEDMSMVCGKNIAGEKTEYLNLVLHSNELIRIHTEEIGKVEKCIKTKSQEVNLA
ncbi:MAG: gas vesicle protein [Syntrophomonadaceae bacterium]|nr:gas vesicle protein [Syntrophomonadaceae bacterium]